MLAKSFQKRLFSQWLHTRLAQAPAQKTVALLVDHSEVKNQELSCLSPVHTSADFRLDLTMNQFAWVYLDQRRVLLLQNKYKAPKESTSSDTDADAGSDAKDKESEEDKQKKELDGKRKVLKGLGGVAAA